MNLGASVAAKLRWSSGKVPTIQNVEVLRGARQFASRAGAALLLDSSEPTALEGVGRPWDQVLDDIVACPAEQPSAQTFAGMAKAFRATVAPMARQVSTRGQQWRHWRSVLTIAIAHDVVNRLLPMTMETLEALSWQLLTLRCTPSHMEQIWGAIAQRHAAAKMVSPLAGPREYSNWKKALSVMQGRPSPMLFPIRKEHLWAMLSLPGLSTAPYVTQRNVLATALMVVCCSRVSEMAELQACDVLFDFDTWRGIPGYEGTAAIRIRKRKNDSIKKGLFPRIGRARKANTMFDLVAWLRFYMQKFGLMMHPRCTRPFQDRKRCPLCPPVFVKAERRGQQTAVSRLPCSRQNMTQAITRSLGLIHVNSRAFSGISARKGGLSTAIEAGVPEPILFMQSGHGQSKAARAYMNLNSPALLFDTWAAFGL